MKKFIFLALSPVLFLMLSEKADACSCIPPQPVEDALGLASAVFEGKVLTVEGPVAPTSSVDPKKITFEVSKFWKGPITRNFSVTTALESASCGFPFETGQEYVVYASRKQGESEAESIPEAPFEVSLCSRTKLLSEASEDLAELPQAHIPAAGNTPEFSVKKGSKWWSTFGIVTVLGFAIYVIKRSK